MVVSLNPTLSCSPHWHSFPPLRSTTFLSEASTETACLYFWWFLNFFLSGLSIQHADIYSITHVLVCRHVYISVTIFLYCTEHLEVRGQIAEGPRCQFVINETLNWRVLCVTMHQMVLLFQSFCKREEISRKDRFVVSKAFSDPTWDAQAVLCVRATGLKRGNEWWTEWKTLRLSTSISVNTFSISGCPYCKHPDAFLRSMRQRRGKQRVVEEKAVAKGWGNRVDVAGSEEGEEVTLDFHSTSQREKRMHLSEGICLCF